MGNSLAKIGRPKGSLNKSTAEARQWFQDHSQKAAKRLVQLCDSEDEKVAVVAIKEVLNRAFGQASVTLGMDQSALQVFAGIKIVISDERKEK